MHNIFDKISLKYISNIYLYLATFFKCYQKNLATLILSVRPKIIVKDHTCEKKKLAKKLVQSNKKQKKIVRHLKDKFRLGEEVFSFDFNFFFKNNNYLLVLV